MSDREEIAKRVAVLRKLGAPQPEAWAESEVEEGIPQTARFLFLRQAWTNIVSATDPSWIDDAIATSTRRPNDPYSGAGRALSALRGRGATDLELTELVRGMQAELLFSFCYLLEDPGEVDAEAEDTVWGLFVLDPDGRPETPLAGLHEAVLETDPTGREMRPSEQWSLET